MKWSSRWWYPLLLRIITALLNSHSWYRCSLQPTWAHTTSEEINPLDTSSSTVHDLIVYAMFFLHIYTGMPPTNPRPLKHWYCFGLAFLTFLGFWHSMPHHLASHCLMCFFPHFAEPWRPVDTIHTPPWSSKPHTVHFSMHTMNFLLTSLYNKSYN